MPRSGEIDVNMPAVLDRKAGAVISAPKYTAEQLEKLECALLRAFLAAHPDFISKNLEENA